MTPRLAAVMHAHFAAFRFARTPAGKPIPWIFHHTRARRRAAIGDRIQSMRSGFARAAERTKLDAELHQHDCGTWGSPRGWRRGRTPST